MAAAARPESDLQDLRPDQEGNDSDGTARSGHLARNLEFMIIKVDVGGWALMAQMETVMQLQ